VSFRNIPSFRLPTLGGQFGNEPDRRGGCGGLVAGQAMPTLPQQKRDPDLREKGKHGSVAVSIESTTS
jgi:hypothetical protein